MKPLSRTGHSRARAWPRPGDSGSRRALLSGCKVTDVAHPTAKRSTRRRQPGHPPLSAQSMRPFALRRRSCGTSSGNRVTDLGTPRCNAVGRRHTPRSTLRIVQHVHDSRSPCTSAYDHPYDDSTNDAAQAHCARRCCWITVDWNERSRRCSWHSRPTPMSSHAWTQLDARSSVTSNGGARALPELARVNPRETELLVKEHAEMRRQLLVLGIGWTCTSRASRWLASSSTAARAFCA